MNSSTSLAALIAHCRKLTRRQHSPDAELLHRYIVQRDAAAFEELLERYAPLVWSVCRRMLFNEADCEDAFQAAFLVLVRRADSIAPGRPLGAWLHTVAVHVADKARTRALRQPRQTIATESATCGDVADELGNRELFRIIDGEIARLPVLLREPFVLCCLEGRTRDEVAAALGCSVAAIKSRLERSRNLLRQRLEKRGIGLPAAFLVLGLTGEHVRASLRAKALHCLLGSAPSAVAALVPAAGVSLASKLTLTAVSLVMVGVLGFGTYRIIETAPQEPPVQAKDIVPKSPQPPAEKPQPRVDRFGDPLPKGAIRRFGTLRFRHAGVEDLAFTPDGKKLIAGLGNQPLSVFDAKTGRKLREVGKYVPSRSLTEFAVSPDGKWIATCGQEVLLWEIETGRLVRELHCGESHALAFSADGKVLAVAGWAGREETEIRIVELATGKLQGKWTFKEGEIVPGYLHPLAFSPDGKYLAGLFSKRREVKFSVYENVSSQVWLLDAKNGARVRIFASPGGLIGSFAFQPGTGRLATIEKKGVLRFWDTETGKESHHFSVAQDKWDSRDGDTPRVLRFSADGRRCVVADGEAGLLVVMDAQTGKDVRRIEVNKASYWIAADLSRDGRAIASARRLGLSSVRVWDVDSGVERLADAGHRMPPTLSLSADERTLIGRSEDGQVIHWDRRSGEAVRRLKEAPGQAGRPVRTPGASGDWTLRGPRWRLSYDFKTSILSVHSLKDGRLLGEAEWNALAQDLALSPDGLYVAATLLPRRWNTVLLWNPEKEKKPRQLTGNVDLFHRPHFSHDGKRLIATATLHNTSPSAAIWVWDVATAKPIHQLAANSPQGQILLTADDRVLIYGGSTSARTVQIWDMETGKQLAQFPEPPAKEGGMNGGLALSADERFLAVIFLGDHASVVSVWETGSWKPVRMLPPTPESNYAESMIFSRDGRSLFVSNSDTTILEWEVAGRFGRGREVLNKDRLNVLWRTLAETPDKAYPAVWEMLDHPTESVPFLIEKVSPVKPVEERRVRQLLAQLDSESFAEREEAGRQLLALGEQIVPRLRRALTERPSLEMKKRIEGVVESLNRLPSTEQLRLLRSVAVLEWSNRPAAIEHLRRLAGGAPFAPLTRAAKAAWQRCR